MRSTILLDPGRDGHGYTVTVPALRGCISEGATFDEAVANAGEASAGFLETLAKPGELIPREEPGPIAVAVEIDAPTPTLAGAVA